MATDPPEPVRRRANGSRCVRGPGPIARKNRQRPGGSGSDPFRDGFEILGHGDGDGPAKCGPWGPTAEKQEPTPLDVDNSSGRKPGWPVVVLQMAHQTKQFPSARGPQRRCRRSPRRGNRLAQGVQQTPLEKRTSLTIAQRAHIGVDNPGRQDVGGDPCTERLHNNAGEDEKAVELGDKQDPTSKDAFRRSRSEVCRRWSS